MKEVRRALEEYEREVEATEMKVNTKGTYLLHAKNFVRWMEGSFYPGIRLPK